MSIRVHVGGQIRPAESAKVSVFDRAYLFGDSVFDTLATVNGQPFALDQHLARLDRFAALVGIAPPSRLEIEAAVRATLAAANNAESRVRIIISRGAGLDSNLDPTVAVCPELTVIVQPRGGPSPEMYDDGVSAIFASTPFPGALTAGGAVKSSNYLPSILATGEARRAGAHEAILCGRDGGVAEGASSNVFCVIAGTVTTPALSVGILPGITRSFVLDLCAKAAIPVREAAFTEKHELADADEVFITSSVRGILPVTKLEGRLVGAGRPGQITQTLMRQYADLCNGSAS